MRSEAQQEHARALAAKNRADRERADTIAVKRAASQARVAAQKAYEQRLIEVAHETQIRLRAEAAARREGRGDA